MSLFPTPSDLAAALPVDGLLAAALALIALYWLIRVGRAARRGLRPRLSWWAVPGLLGLLLAPLLDVPALFGVGAAFLLLSEFAPGAFRPSRTRPAVAWPLVGLTVGIALLFSALRAADPHAQTPAAVLAVLLTLAGLGGLLGVAFWPAPRPEPEALGFLTRWNSAVTPEWPELAVSLSARGAHLKNLTRTPLRLAGWSPVGVNAWLRVRDAEGHVLSELRAGQEALLPVTERDRGVRVWYGAPAVGQPPRVFRADWTPTAHADERVLN